MMTLHCSVLSLILMKNFDFYQKYCTLLKWKDDFFSTETRPNSVSFDTKFVSIVFNSR